jgi:hypothetical protein
LCRWVRFIGRKWNNVNISISIRHADSLEAPDTVGDYSYRTACPSEAQSVRLFLERRGLYEIAAPSARSTPRRHFS